MTVIIDDPERLPETLHAYRQALGLTRIELSESIAPAAGKTVKGFAAQLWFWETGRRQPLPAQLGQWLGGLGLKLALVSGDDPATALVQRLIVAARAVLYAKLREPGMLREPELVARIMDLGDVLAELSAEDDGDAVQP